MNTTKTINKVHDTAMMLIKRGRWDYATTEEFKALTHFEQDQVAAKVSFAFLQES